MNEPIYLTGPCEHCGGLIEFPPESAGQRTPCPLCGQTTAMIPTITTSVRPQARRRTGLIFPAIMGVVVIGLAFTAWKLMAPGDAETPTAAAPPPAPTAADPVVNTPTNPPPKAESLPPRSLDDLKAGPVSFEKAKTGSLLYAVGTLRNDSGHQRFGVTIEIELTDARGEPAGTAKDYRAVIEPRQEWRFRALVLNSKATQGKVTQVREE